jgi:hypothetical protein
LIFFADSSVVDVIDDRKGDGRRRTIDILLIRTYGGERKNGFGSVSVGTRMPINRTAHIFG